MLIRFLETVMRQNHLNTDSQYTCCNLNTRVPNLTWGREDFIQELACRFHQNTVTYSHTMAMSKTSAAS